MPHAPVLVVTGRYLRVAGPDELRSDVTPDEALYVASVSLDGEPGTAHVVMLSPDASLGAIDLAVVGAEDGSAAVALERAGAPAPGVLPDGADPGGLAALAEMLGIVGPLYHWADPRRRAEALAHPIRRAAMAGAAAG